MDDYKLRKVKALNLHNITKVAGEFGIPVMKRVYHIPPKMIGYNFVRTRNMKDACAHFFLDDCQFERVWKYPELQIDKLSQCDSVLSPDFSLYTTYPVGIQIYNTFRNMAIGQYFQNMGLVCIPTASWSDERSFAFCFDGLPKSSVVAVSTKGVFADHAEDMFRKGIKELVERKNPTAILIHGKEIDADYGKAKIYTYENEESKKLGGY